MTESQQRDTLGIRQDPAVRPGGGFADLRRTAEGAGSRETRAQESDGDAAWRDAELYAVLGED
ncbi:hypothetical protein [Streptomyces sp. NRRL B-24484]|uniref:hypothetical protein n=1 Tax=Streptomyces sp. NRRL B-24484 TaxID=1463833 RepID=UPI0004BED8E1|nr:hypothetical protein [Streptomyces sp. NRRL B-24484]